MKRTILASLLAAALPLVAFAQTLDTIILKGGIWVTRLTGIVAAAALLVFFWGVLRYIAAAGDEKGKERGKTIMTWGVIALFVMFSVFGIVRFLQNSFGIGSGPQQMRPPTVIFP
jgi:hypothetical protein